MNRLSLRERRLVAIAILVALIAAVARGLVMPIVDGFAERDASRAALLATWAADERAVVQIASVRRAAEAQNRDAARFRLPGDTALIAADRFKERIGAAVTATGGELRGIEDVAARPGTIRVRTDARLTTGQLVALVAGLQRAEPLVIVETLTLAADQALQTGRAAPMDLRLEIAAPYPAPR